jgi:hypothetical protein
MIHRELSAVVRAFPKHADEEAESVWMAGAQLLRSCGQL